MSKISQQLAEELARTKFWNKVDLPFEATNEDCWLWNASKNNCGYGQFWFNKKSMRAHRLSYLWYKGEIPEGLEVCHKCDEPSCINPNHLFVATHQQNLQDCADKNRLNNEMASRNYCSRGHEYTPENTWNYVSKEGYPYRKCKRCEKRNRYGLR